MIEEGWGDDGHLWDPHPHLAGRRVVLLVKAWRLSAAEVRHEPTDQVVAESGAVDLFDEEAVSNAYEMSTAMAMVLLRGLRLLKPETNPSRDGEQGRGGGMPRFEAVLGGSIA